MRKQLTQVHIYRDAFGLSTRPAPYPPTAKEISARIFAIKDTASQIYSVWDKGDITGLARVYAELILSVLGGVVEAGMSGIMESVLDEVHRSVMTQRDADGQYRIYSDGTIPKTDYYSEPELDLIVELGKAQVTLSEPSAEDVLKKYFIEEQFASAGIAPSELGQIKSEKIEEIWAAYKRKPDFAATIKAMKEFRDAKETKNSGL